MRIFWARFHLINLIYKCCPLHSYTPYLDKPSCSSGLMGKWVFLAVSVSDGACTVSYQTLDLIFVWYSKMSRISYSPYYKKAINIEYDWIKFCVHIHKNITTVPSIEALLSQWQPSVTPVTIRQSPRWHFRIVDKTSLERHGNTLPPLFRRFPIRGFRAWLGEVICARWTLSH